MRLNNNITIIKALYLSVNVQPVFSTKVLIADTILHPPLEMGLSFYMVIQAMQSFTGLQSPQDPKYWSSPTELILPQ